MTRAKSELPPLQPARSGRKPVQTHEAIVLAGCMIHTEIDEAGLGWLSRTLKCKPDIPDPPSGTFNNLDLTMRVSTFDDIDTCARVATKVLGLSQIAAIGLRELLVNAVEHGNLGITFDEKSELLKNGHWQEEIERRLRSPEHRQKFASVSIKRDRACFAIVIRDQGSGFDWQTYLETREKPSTLLHGRGTSLAMSAEFAAVQYRGTGSEVFVSGTCDLG
ncbi:MAG: hypothetical protein ACPGRZ_08505 [Alphaproteobacteria bacterium]